MRMRLLAAFALASGLALAPGARADDKDKDQNKGGNQAASGTQTIRGMIAGVTVEGEIMIDYKTDRAVEADMTMLTIVGSPRRGSSNEDSAKTDGNKDNTSASGRRRPNVYVIWLSERTKVRDESGQADKQSQKDQQPGKSNAASGKVVQEKAWDAIEVGDRVEVTFTPRDLSSRDNPRHRKHGRHRTYFGDAASLTILSMPARDRDGNTRNDQNSNK